jgi:small-conductance mechanosensitive channel
LAAISIGSVEVDVVPNTRGIYGRLQQALVPPAGQIGDEVGRIIGRQIVTHITPAIRDGINAGGRAARPAAARQGDETAGAFSRSLKARLEAAFKSLPRADVRLSSTGFDADMARLRARLETLSNKRIGIDVDAGVALAEITDIEARLRRLGAEHPNVQVRADTAAALAQLAALRAEVDAVDGKKVDIDTSKSVSGMQLLVATALTFGPAILPVLPVVAAGLGAIAAAATAAGAGIGGIALVAIPAFKQIGTVLQAQKAAQQAATTETIKGSQASSQGASKALQMAGAQQALATAERNGARQIAQAQQQVKQAKQAAADAIVQAAQRNQQAARQVQDAEKSLAAAQVSAKKAQEDLTAARQQAAQELEDLNNQLADSVLSQRDAEIQLKEATAQRNAVLRNANATELDKQKALLAYDQAVQRLKEQTTETKRLKSETTAANKAGVKGTDTYKSAQDRLMQAQQNVATQQQAVKDAQAEAARTQVETARQVAEAQQRVSEATANVAVAQQNAADSVASAQRQIESASLSAASGMDQAAVAQAKYQAELAKLTPSARDTFNAFLNLRTAFSAWAKSLQPAVMPIFTRALVSLRNTLPTLTPFVKGAADAIKGLQDRASASVKTPFWQGFKKDLQGSVKPAITGLGISFGNVLKGMAGIIDAFLPHMDGISSRLQRITKRFANWGANLKGSPEFERFLSYASDKGPLLADTLGKIGRGLLNVGEALSPLSGPLLKLLGGLAEAIGIIADKAPWFILLIYGIIVATKLWTIAQWAFNAAAAANPYVLIGLAILALIALVIYAYNKFGWFRTAVQAAWDGIKTAALFVWNNVLKPVFTFIWQALQTVGRWALWLWNNAIKPAWDAISLAARILLTAIVVAVILPIIVAVKLLGKFAMWLWTNAFKPAFQKIGSLAAWLWKNAIKPAWDGVVLGAKFMWNNVLKPIFRFFWEGLKTVGGWAKWLYEKAIKPAWDKISSAIGTVYRVGIKPIFDGWKRIIKGLGGVFSDAVGAIKTQWDKIKNVARKPVQFIVDTVYNNGIVGVWNKVAGAFGAPKLSKFTFASGGIMPGYTPGRDVHKFISPTGGALELSGGEAIMRPEFTRAVGSGFVGSMNALARSRGANGVKAALAPVFGGNPMTPTDHTLRYKDGGIFGWIGGAANKLAGVGSAAWNGIKKSASWLTDTLEASARAGVKYVVDPILKNFPGMDTGFGSLVRHIPTKILDALFGYSKDADKKGAGGIGGPKIQAALKWAKTQNGKPYQWGGNGNPSWDCSGFMSAIESVIRGQKPHRRWATGAFSGKTAPPGWVYHGNSPFRIGITNAGVGHTAGTLGKTKVESRGGDGVIVGSRARGYNDKLFRSWYGFEPGKYDSGGYLQPGLNLAYNGTGRPEPVFTTSQANALTTLAGRGQSGPMSFEGDLRLDSGEFLGRVRGEATAVMQAGQQELISVLNAG